MNAAACSSPMPFCSASSYPIRVLNQAIAEARRCDLLLVAGSSLHVVPAADLPFLAADNGAKAIIVNLEAHRF